MRLPFRKKEKKGSLQLDVPPEFRPAGAGQMPRFPPTARSAHALAQLPTTVLARIFAYVCPHARDESFDTCEDSARGDNCVLCDLRDLSHCAKVSRAWRATAIKVLYHSVRIEPVHYCKMEAWLAERRKKTGRFDRNGVPEDTAQVRLRLLRRTVRDDPTRIGCLVQYLKIPYMLREFCYVELAQTIAVLPDLHYVDLPEGMFCDDPSYATLRLEVQARCPKLRKMTYVAGAERSFAALANGQVWPRLQVLELSRLNVDPSTMRNVLGCLVNLRALKVSQTDSLSDEVLLSAEGLPTLPPLEELILKDTPRVTAAGLVEYLAWFETQQALKVLTLKDTGVQPAHLADVLTMATSLRTLALQAKVSEPLPHGLAPLASQSLRTLRFEVAGRTSSAQDASAANSHYAYVAQSILSGNLPRLRKLFVHDESFPDKLQSSLPAPGGVFSGAGGARHRQQSSSLSSTRGAPPALRVSPGGSPPGAGSNGLASPKYSSPMASPVSSPRAVPRSLGAAGQSSQNRLSSNNPFAPEQPAGAVRRAPIQTLEIFTKSDEFGKWNFARVDTVHSRSPQSSAGAGASTTRPESHYGLAADVQGHDWDNGGSRRSVLVGNAEGGFLALPGPATTPFAPPPDLPALAGEDYRPRSSGGLSFSRLRR